MRLHRTVVLDRHLDIATQKRDQHIRRTAERHDGDIDTGGRFEQLRR